MIDIAAPPVGRCACPSRRSESIRIPQPSSTVHSMPSPSARRVSYPLHRLLPSALVSIPSTPPTCCYISRAPLRRSEVPGDPSRPRVRHEGRRRGERAPAWTARVRSERSGCRLGRQLSGIGCGAGVCGRLQLLEHGAIKELMADGDAPAQPRRLKVLSRRQPLSRGAHCLQLERKDRLLVGREPRDVHECLVRLLGRREACLAPELEEHIGSE